MDKQTQAVQHIVHDGRTSMIVIKTGIQAALDYLSKIDEKLKTHKNYDRHLKLLSNGLIEANNISQAMEKLYQLSKVGNDNGQE